MHNIRKQLLESVYRTRCSQNFGNFPRKHLVSLLYLIYTGQPGTLSKVDFFTDVFTDHSVRKSYDKCLSVENKKKKSKINTGSTIQLFSLAVDQKLSCDVENCYSYVDKIFSNRTHYFHLFSANRKR